MIDNRRARRNYEVIETLEVGISLLGTEVKALREGRVSPRNLLAHKKEVLKLGLEVKQKGLTLVPMKMYFKGRWAKVEVALARGRSDYDKRQVLKKRDADRDIKRFMK